MRLIQQLSVWRCAAIACVFQLFAATAWAESTDPQGLIYLDQGWNGELREKFYFTPQGSRLIPYKWFLSLEQSEDTALFSNSDNLSQFGWINPENGPSELNPDGLPIGFTKDPVDNPGTGHWLGLTCSACHTSNVSYHDAKLRIEGAPSRVDFGRFLSDLSAAITSNHPVFRDGKLEDGKFTRFAARVLGANQSTEAIEQLAQSYVQFVVQFRGRAWMRTPPHHAGPGRVDALTQIVNSLAVFDLGHPNNLVPPVAPTSYPFLWLTPHLDWVQWNPIASNPIARNAGEVMGVFGEVNFGLDQSQPMFSSTILYKNLFELEEWIKDLKPPRWPEDVLGAIDRDSWSEGKRLYEKDCLGCHNMPPFARTKPDDNIAGLEFIKIKRVNYLSIGTDPLYVQSLITRFTESGSLGPVLFGGRPIVPGAEFFTTAVGATVRKGLSDLGLTPQERLAYAGYRFYPPRSPNEAPVAYQPPSVTDLKAGPLLGIWATAPYFHNGSVPNLYEVLSPQEQRSKVFWVGSHELDTVTLGFVSIEHESPFRFDTSIPGNHNTGHNYPKQGYDHVQRLHIIEYLKDPERF